MKFRGRFSIPRRLLRGLAVLLAALAAVALVIFLVVRYSNGSVVVNGQIRSYILYVPKSYRPDRPVPLVISIHGHAEWPAHLMETTQWNQVAEENGFLVVYPSGSNFPMHWYSSGKTDGPDRTAKEIAFFSALIDQLEQKYAIDPARIYANGFSNGGGMSFLLSCKLADRIAAIGSVSGGFLLPWDECTPSRPVPIIVFHGDDDRVVPYTGGPSAYFNYPFPDIRTWVETYAQRNGCQETYLLVPAYREASGVHYTRCSQQADVFFYTIQGGGHTWPAGQDTPEFKSGHAVQYVDATRKMWEFFQQHPLKR